MSTVLAIGILLVVLIKVLIKDLIPVGSATVPVRVTRR